MLQERSYCLHFVMYLLIFTKEFIYDSMYDLYI